MVLAHDANCFIDWFGAAHDEVRAAAAPNWHYEHISDDVLPALLEAGVTQAQIDTMLVENPVRYFTPAEGRCGMSPGWPGPAGPDRSDLGGIFDMTGVTRGPDGIKRYGGLPRNLVHMLRASVDGTAPRRPSSRPVPRMPGAPG